MARAVDAVLADAPFNSHIDPHGLEQLARVWHERMTEGALLSDGLLVLAVVLLAAVVAAAITWAVGHLLERPPAAAPFADRAGFEAVASNGTPELRDARTALGAGDHRLAVELAWRAAMAHFGATDSEAATPRQWARRAAARLEREQRHELGRLLTLHEACCYAGHAPSRRAAETAVILAGRLGVRA